MKTVTVHLAEGFEETEAITIIDVLRRAGLNVITVSVSGQQTVVGSHKIPVVADAIFDKVDYKKVDVIILPGGMPGSKNLDAHAGLKEQIKEFHSEQKLLGAICAAPLVFGHLNLLEGKKAVCYPGFEKELYGAETSTHAVAVDGNLVTSRGVGTALQFALKLTEILVGKEKAIQLADGMLLSSEF